MIPGKEALERLMEGNQRYAADLPWRSRQGSQARRSELTKGQQPFAVLLGCSDSRVPAEIIFDLGLGDLFVIRVAGNIAAPSQIGSIEYAVDQLGVRLVMVLGHSDCGAIAATMDHLEQPAEDLSPNLAVIVNRVRPVIASMPPSEAPETRQERLERAVRANVRCSLRSLVDDSPLLEKLERSGDILIVGAKYSLNTGVVRVFETSPPRAGQSSGQS